MAFKISSLKLAQEKAGGHVRLSRRAYGELFGFYVRGARV